MAILRIVLPIAGVDNNSINFMKKVAGERTMESKNVGYIKIPPTWCWKHQDVIKIMSDTPLNSHEEATCSNNIHIYDVF